MEPQKPAPPMSLTIKVELLKLDISKTFKFDPKDSIQDVIDKVQSKVPESVPKSNENPGIFFENADDPRKSHWLEHKKSLDFYGIESGQTVLQYKDKFRYLKVTMLDGTVKTVQVDDSRTVEEILQTITGKVGITNVDEYSLFLEAPSTDPTKEKEEVRVGTLKRDRDQKSMKETTLKRVEEREKKKMETLKKKLHTDDEMNWLAHDKTLQEAGVGPTDTVVLRRKYMYEQSVNIKNPVEINLLYVQSKTGIIDGTYPVTMDEAAKFAALQIQIDRGDYADKIYVSLEMKDFLPKDYVKNKEEIKKIKEEHKQFIGLDIVNAKYKYIQLCQNLATYGVTFFLVKEKMKGKNRLVPRLLGVNKESVLRVDEKTKEVLKTWPLTQVRRWAASPNSFTLDFGDYVEGYYSVQTPEGEQISQLIAGYIDIILKKRRANEMMDDNGDEESPMIEDTVIPSTATILQQMNNKENKAEIGSVAMPAVLRTGAQGASHYSVEKMEDESVSSVRGMQHSAHQPPMGLRAQMQGTFSVGQRALITGLDKGKKAIVEIMPQIDAPMEEAIPQGDGAAERRWMESRMEISRNNVANRLAAMSAATAAIVSLTSGDPEAFNYTAVGAGVSTITSNLEDLVKGIKMIAALMDDDEDAQGLLDAAKNLAGAFTNLLNALQPGEEVPREQLLKAAGEIGSACTGILQALAIGDSEADFVMQEKLLELSKEVAKASAALVLKAKNCAMSVEDSDGQGQDTILNSAQEVTMTTSQLVACAKVLSPHIDSPLCQEQMIEAAKLVASSVDGTVATCHEGIGDENMMGEVSKAAQDVTDALNNLLQQIRDGAKLGTGGPYDDNCDDILLATDRLFNSMGNAGEMVKQAKILAQGTSKLVNGIKGDAESQDDDDTQKRLLAAAKVLADATAKLVEAAKGAAKNPHDASEQEKLKRAAENLRAATNAAASNALKKKLILRLENAAKQAVASATQLVSATKASVPSNRNPSSQQQMDDASKGVIDNSDELIHGVRNSKNQPDSSVAQLALISASKAFIPPAAKLVASSKAGVPTVGDNAVALQLSNSSKHTANALNELKIAADKAAEACGSLEIDNALAAVKDLENQLEEHRISADNGTLGAMPGDTADFCALEVGATSKTVGASMAQLLTAAAQANDSYTGIAARDTAGALKVLANAVRGVAATSDVPSDQQAILKAAQVVMHESAALIEEAKNALDNPNDANNQQNLATVAKRVSQALNNVVNCLPGQRLVEDAMIDITNASQVLNMPDIIFPETSEPFSATQDRLNTDSLQLNSAANEVVHAARGPSQQLAIASARFSRSYQDFQTSGLTLAGQIKDKEAQDELVTGLRKTSSVSSKLLLASKTLAADPGAPNSKNMLAAAAKGVTDAINQLLNQALTAAPGQKECDSAVRNVQGMANVLENPVEPVNEQSFFACLETATQKSQVLAQNMQVINTSLKKEDPDALSNAVGVASEAVCALTESTAQAAYLVAIADPTSVAGRQGLVDQSQFAKAQDAIKGACEGLLNKNSSQQQVLSAATIIAKHTAGLCNACKVASTKTDNPVAKRHFVQSAKDVANSTANLVKYIKVFASDMNEPNREDTEAGTKPLLNAVNNLVTYASSSEFASVPSKIGAQGKAAQYPLIISGKSMISSSSNYFLTSKQLAVNNKDQPTWQLFAQHSKALADAMKKIVSAIKDNAPGQAECDQAIDSIQASTNKVDQAALQAISDNLKPTTEDSLKGYEDKMNITCSQLKECVPNLVAVAKRSPEQIGHQVIALANLIEPLAKSSIGFASKLNGGAVQTGLLDKTKTAAEAANQLVDAAKEAGGNPRAVHTHPAVDEAGEDLTEALNELLAHMASLETGAVNGFIDGIHGAMAEIVKASRAGSPVYGDAPNVSFVECQDKMVKKLKIIARTSQDMVGKANIKPQELSGLSKDLFQNYNMLTEDTRLAIKLCRDDDIAERLKGSVHALGDACGTLVKISGDVMSNPQDAYSKKFLSDQAKHVSEKVSFVLATLQASALGTQECISAGTALEVLIGDINTTIMFASSNLLQPENPSDSFGDHREGILKTAKNLVEDTKSLVVAAQGTQEQLATSAQNVLKSMTVLVDNVKLGAAALGKDDVEAQILLLNAAKDVANALHALINSTKNSSGKPANDPAMDQLKTSAKSMVTSVSSLLKTVRSVEDEASRGVRAIESAVDAVKEAIIGLEKGDDPNETATPEQLINATKGITVATAKAVSAGTSGRQEEIVQAANYGRRYCTELLIVCKAAAFNAESESIKVATIVKGRDTAQAYCEVLDHVSSVIIHPTTQNKHHLTVLSTKVATSIGALVDTAKELKGSDWVNPEDPNVIAENELLGAAASIEAAARKLAELKPRARPKEADESLNFEEQILEAAKAITAAAGALVKAATQAQRELVAMGRVNSPESGSDDGQWSQGLISAARLVANATGSLCEAANAAVQGNASEEKLIASAKAVANSTAQLLLACRVKADPNSKAQKGLQEAGHKVKSASELLVKSAQHSLLFAEEDDNVAMSGRFADDMRAEIEAQELILKKERELEKARLKLAHIRKARYVPDSDEES